MHDRWNDVHVARRSAQQRPSMPASRLVARGGSTAVRSRFFETPRARRTQLRAGSVNVASRLNDVDDRCRIA